MQLPARIIHLVDEVSSRNFGIWHAALASSVYTAGEGIGQILVCPTPASDFALPAVFSGVVVCPQERTGKNEAKAFFKAYNPTDTLVISHGAWRFPTRWGALAKEMGYTWLYTPHGMLEPWSLQQKRWKKILYGMLVEFRLASRADAVRAVGSPEAGRLRERFARVVHIPNGIYPEEVSGPPPSPPPPLRFLFLARLHHKKGIMPLVKAWEQSSLNAGGKALLCIAGTDDGEKDVLLEWMSRHPHSGIRFAGPVFGREKEELFSASHFYILPSLSEGFPTSVLEAMAHGLIPLISRGCNFPEALAAGVAVDCGTEPETLKRVLEEAASWDEGRRTEMSGRARSFAAEGYLWPAIGKQLLNWYRGLPRKKTT
jgi:glycosyltransferase involved in cell wall biosynthesis